MMNERVEEWWVLERRVVRQEASVKRSIEGYLQLVLFEQVVE
jgi:hypothetical protein